MPIFYLLSIIKSVCVISCTNVCKDMEVQIAFKISNSYVSYFGQVVSNCFVLPCHVSDIFYVFHTS